jgi:hypothetical protein
MGSESNSRVEVKIDASRGEVSGGRAACLWCLPQTRGHEDTIFCTLPIYHLLLRSSLKGNAEVLPMHS